MPICDVRKKKWNGYGKSKPDTIKTLKYKHAKEFTGIHSSIIYT